MVYGSASSSRSRHRQVVVSDFAREAKTTLALRLSLMCSYSNEKLDVCQISLPNRDQQLKWNLCSRPPWGSTKPVAPKYVHGVASVPLTNANYDDVALLEDLSLAGQPCDRASARTHGASI